MSSARATSERQCSVIQPSATAEGITRHDSRGNRLRVHSSGSTVTTCAYQYDGMKRTEATGTSVTTLVWDGSDYLQGRG